MGLKSFLKKRKYLKNVSKELNYFEKFLLLTFLFLLFFNQSLNLLDFKGELSLIKQNLQPRSFNQSDILQNLNDVKDLYKKIKPLLPKNESAINLISTIDDFFIINSDLFSNISDYSPSNILASKDFKNLNIAFDAIQRINFSVKNINTALQNFKEKDINFTYRNTFFDLKDKFSDLTNKIEFISSNILMLKEFAGLESTHRYLFLIQNNAEIRTSGGFTGMLAIVEVSGVEIQKIDVLDIYELDGQYLPKYDPPYDLKSLNKKLFLRDLNYFNNKEAYIENLIKELATLKLPSFDTVLMVNQSFFSELLDFLPSNYLFANKLKLNPNNYFYALTMFIEVNKEKNSDDKKIIKDLLSSLVKNVKKKDQLVKIGEIINQAISQNDLFIHPLDPEFQKNLINLNLRQDYNFISNNNVDSFQVNFSSIGGNKTDLLMNTSIDHTTILKKNSRPSHKVVLTRQHKFTIEDEIYIDSIARSLNLYPLSNDLKHILIKGDNKVYTKMYLPIGSKVTSVKLDGKPTEHHIDLSVEDHAQVLYVLMEVSPYQEQALEVEYESGFKLQKNGIYNYNFNLIPPNGLLNYSLNKKFDYSNLTPERMFVNNTKDYSFKSIQDIKTNTEFKVLMSN